MTIDIDAIRKDASRLVQLLGRAGDHPAAVAFRANDLASGQVPALCDEIEQLRRERDHARRLAALTAEQEAANAQIIVDTRAERDAARAMADELRAELDRVRADLAAAHNHAHRQDTNLQQIARAKDETAAERDQLKRALRAALNGQTHVWDKQRIDWVPVAEYVARKQEVSR